MSARGARSRKVAQKDIEKKEKKSADKGKAIESVRTPHDAFAEWRPTPGLGSRDTSLPSRTITISSDASRATSRSSSTNGGSRTRQRLNTINSHDSSEYKAIPVHRPKTSMSGSASISDTSSKGKDKTKYQGKGGKDTKAPRGRGGGVPIKKSVVNSPPPPLFRLESNLSNTSNDSKSWANFSVWEGGDPIKRSYLGFEFDEFMQNGNVLIFFKEEQSNEDRPEHQIRASLEVLENSGSTWLSNALLYGRIDDNEDDWTLPGSPESSTHAQGLVPGQRRMLSPTSPGGRSPPSWNIDQAYSGVLSSRSDSRAQYYAEDGSIGEQSPPSFHQAVSQAPTHELWFTAPANLRTFREQRLHHVAIRNFLAMLHNKPIVGAELFEMLNTLQPEIEVMYDLDHGSLSPRERSVNMITSYLEKHKLDDPRASIKIALSLLSWAERDNIRWRQGYLESFVHLAGVMSPQVEELADFKRLSIGTRRNLGIASKSLQLKVMEAEEKLATFEFGELWEESPKAATSPIYQSYQAFRTFLANYYTKIYGNWPPQQGKSWLNRKVVLALQEDFGALYDYLVNRDVVWDSREEKPGKKWEMVHRKTEDFKADFPDLSLTDMLVSFDNRHSYQHIPHPYPLLPREIPQVAKAAPKKSFFSGLKKNKTDTTKDAKAHLQLSIVFSDATNIDKMENSLNGSTLIDQYERFELAADLSKSTPREARLGRWLLIYSALQVLSTLSVDVQSLKYTDNVRYFLCTDLRRCPDWVTAGQVERLESSQQRSWCWQRSWDPTPIPGQPIELEGNSMLVGGELEGADTLTAEESQRLEGATMLNEDIQRISEKIETMGIEANEARMRQQFERRIETEKVMRGEFGRKRTDDSYRLTESDFTQQQRRPSVPARNPLRSPTLSQAYPARPDEHAAMTSQDYMSPGTFPVPPQGYGGRGYFPDERRGWAQ